MLPQGRNCISPVHLGENSTGRLFMPSITNAHHVQLGISEGYKLRNGEASSASSQLLFTKFGLSPARHLQGNTPLAASNLCRGAAPPSWQASCQVVWLLFTHLAWLRARHLKGNLCFLESQVDSIIFMPGLNPVEVTQCLPFLTEEKQAPAWVFMK